MLHSRYLRLIATAVLAAPLSLGRAGGAPAAPAAQGAAFRSAAPPTTGELDATGLRRLTAARWKSYRTKAAGPTIRVSPAYADPTAIAQRWSSFFESLVHGSELSLLNAYIAPLDEVRALCGGLDVLGCYADDRLVVPDQGADGIDATSIATHEYGHHVAFNRVDPPWIALDEGTKRWATSARVCIRTAAGTAYPGAEDANYPLNPGEAFAESYRVLNETAAGLPPTWPIVDPSFQPDATALAAVRADVVDPWTAPTLSAKSAQFSGKARTWTTQVTTPLDGKLHLQIQPGSADVAMLSADGRTVVARGTWTRSGAKALDYIVCGQRTFLLRVTRDTPSRRFALNLSIP